MSVTVTVPALRSATRSGTGELTLTGVTARTFAQRLPGTGRHDQRRVCEQRHG
jgi:hypothetical protein